MHINLRLIIEPLIAQYGNKRSGERSSQTRTKGGGHGQQWNQGHGAKAVSMLVGTFPIGALAAITRRL